MKATGIQGATGTAAFWRMQFESCQLALAEVIAENTENVETLRDLVVDHGGLCDDHQACLCSMGRAARLVAHILPQPAAPTP